MTGSQQAIRRASHRAHSQVLAHRPWTEPDSEAPDQRTPSRYWSVRQEGLYPDHPAYQVMKMQIAGTRRWVAVQDPEEFKSLWKPRPKPKPAQKKSRPKPQKRKPRPVERWIDVPRQPVSEPPDFWPQRPHLPGIEPHDLNYKPCPGCQAWIENQRDTCTVCRLLG